MSKVQSLSELFAMDDTHPPAAALVDGTGVISYHALLELSRREEIYARAPWDQDQFQPASIDLRLGRRAWRVGIEFHQHR